MPRWVRPEIDQFIDFREHRHGLADGRNDVGRGAVRVEAIVRFADGKDCFTGEAWRLQPMAL